MHDSNCVFCELGTSHAQGMIYEDDKCFVQPDKYPSANGHMLVITKDHYPDMLSAPEGVVTHAFMVARKMGSLAKGRLGATGVNIATNIGRSAGQIIMHMHIHILPRYDSESSGFDFGKGKQITPAQVDALVQKMRS